MDKYSGIIFISLFAAIVILRNFNLKSQGIDAIEFGKKDKKDFLIIPFAIFYFYIISANAFDYTSVPNQKLFNWENSHWIGIVLCGLALAFFIYTMISFNKSFRVGLVENSEQGLVTKGAFSISRNPIYVSFAIMLIGQFLIFLSWILLIYIFLGISMFHRQILREEKFLEQQYGKAFDIYRNKVRRYL
jgi:protein-S-isoprenylcysteine O-methyltransferase Ste14